MIGAKDDADNIRASGQKPHQKAEDMTAPTIVATPKIPLIKGRRPDMTMPIAWISRFMNRPKLKLKKLASRAPQIIRSQLSQRGSPIRSRARMYFQIPYFW